MVLSPVDVKDLEMRVSDYWDCRSGWIWGAFAHKLPASTLLKLASIGLSSGGADKDCFVWRGEGGKFSVRAATGCRWARKGRRDGREGERFGR